MAGIADLNRAVIVAVGGNLRGPFRTVEDLLENALARFADAGLPILARSAWWQSAAWPDSTQPAYRNAVVIVGTEASPDEVLATLIRLEADLGRTRTTPNAPRTLDLDLIAHGRTQIEQPGLTLPHPRAHERRFVMGPLAEIAPDWVHPGLGKSAKSLAATARVGTDATHLLAPPRLRRGRGGI